MKKPLVIWVTCHERGLCAHSGVGSNTGRTKAETDFVCWAPMKYPATARRFVDFNALKEMSVSEVKSFLWPGIWRPSRVKRAP